MARLEKEAQDERARHERRMAELETRRREVLRNKRNADKLSSLLAQLKEVQDDMMGSSDEEFAPHVEAIESSAPLAPERSTPLSIGKACANAEVFVLNEQNEVVPAGVKGELCVRGPNVMTGYWGLPEQSAKSRIPFTLHPSLGAEMIYRTGDLVRQEADGHYTYLGRRDNMIKSRGYRIELGEIETVLYSHPDVQEAAVIPIPDDEIGNRIKAFVVLHNGKTLKSTALQAFCAARIPEYMLPHTFEFRKALPKTSTGKVDKTSLKKEQVAGGK